MATNTTNYSFKKPDESDFYDVQDQNGNWDMADEALKSLDTPTFEDYTGSTPVPAANTAIDGIKSKTKLSALMSNIKAAFKGACLIGHIVNNCVTNNPNLPLSAAQGKVLMDLYTQLNGEIGTLKSVSGTTVIGNGTREELEATSLTLEPGVWIITCYSEFFEGTIPTNSIYNTTLRSNSNGRIMTVRSTTTNGGGINVIHVAKINAADTFKITSFDYDFGGSVKLNINMYAVRIK